MKTYYEMILSKNSRSSFINSFEQFWSEEFEHSNLHLSSPQLQFGTRLRPILVAWGYYANLSLDDAQEPNESYNELLKLSYAVELLHKSSIIIDDLIDGDTKRKGNDSYHVQHGSFEAILSSLFLIGKSFEKISTNADKNNNLSSMNTNILANTLSKMSYGALSELELTKNKKLFDLNEIKEIIDNETTSLIKSSFLLGFISSAKNYNNDTIELVGKVGQLSGYIFQILNDLEPFSNTNKNKIHKGIENLDIQVSRKNYIVAFLYGFASKNDRLTINELVNSSKVDSTKITLTQLLTKYDIHKKIMDYVDEIHIEINKSIELLSKILDNKKYTDELKTFVNFMINTALDKI
ncbi:polyprenyl synthetase family protein [Candidatus Enterococcus ikei]|uniref:Polyprenyl synthetase family protein n=1 Tax=Candidatus Enterococcus ikei TaxID=2815326 RepID=A0ABS3H381_9ENTE|nr:polyprenyl synthetase family protein [Enterococcus sp. DIV0869a]MBO0441975.1 polyprenyl synthetase family protein [Enterococcus sp. DIV0869a]